MKASRKWSDIIITIESYEEWDRLWGAIETTLDYNREYNQLLTDDERNALINLSNSFTDCR